MAGVMVCAKMPLPGGNVALLNLTPADLATLSMTSMLHQINAAPAWTSRNVVHLGQLDGRGSRECDALAFRQCGAGGAFRQSTGGVI